MLEWYLQDAGSVGVHIPDFRGVSGPAAGSCTGRNKDSCALTLLTLQQWLRPASIKTVGMDYKVTAPLAVDPLKTTLVYFVANPSTVVDEDDVDYGDASVAVVNSLQGLFRD